MAKAKTTFICERCGGESAQWHGRCPACGEWNALVEFRPPAAPLAGARRGPASRPTPAGETDAAPRPRLLTNLGEFDRVLGGGLVPGMLALLSGDPGVGKSTLLLQVAHRVASDQGLALYVSGEESISQVGLRGQRLGAQCNDLLLLAESDVEGVADHVQAVGPRLLVVDSIQAMCAPDLGGPPGSVGQVRECAARLLRLAKDLGVPTILVGHVTKDGVLAGPRLLEHMVDMVLSLEGDRHSEYRILRSSKNRFGSTDEIGLFLMAERGLEGVPDASAALLAQRRSGAPGSAVAPTLEGSRPLLVEVQGLVTQASPGGSPRRSVTGLDHARACLIMAVLEKRAGLPLAGADVFANVPGGLRVSEPACDLAVALALASSFRDEPLAEGTACVGEVGLTGEIRSVPQLGRRLSELARQGFRRCIAPKQAEARAAAKLEVVVVDDLAGAFRAAFGDHPTHT